MTDYLPEDATIEQACNWLQAKTGQTWILPRLLECHLTPHFWLDYKPGYPAIFGDRIEGYQTRMMFQGDLSRLKSDGADALVNMLAAHDGSLLKVEPGWRVSLSELRFKRNAVERVAAIINKAKTAPAKDIGTPAPVVASDGPAPLTTNEIANCFAELRGWDVARWKRELGSPDDWLKACQKRKGTRGRGGYESTWLPVQIAASLVKQDPKTARSLRARFKKQEPLKPWLELFEINIPDNSDSQ
jgi:hypothetical protein